MSSTPEGSTDRAAPMAAAPFVWRADGRPDWRSMWTSFCELALFGGPPHRGAEQALHGPRGDGAGVSSDPEMMGELCRGIRETTGLDSEPAAPGWIAVTCESRAMAEWLAAAIVLENVEVRVEDARVLLPAGPRFRLENEVKSIITVVAKTHHYWTAHRGRQREGVARPLRVGVGGAGEGKTRLIDSLRRRYGRRRAVLASAAQVLAVTDHAVDLVLVELGEDGDAPGFESSMVDATVGVFSAPAVAGALRRDERGLDAWHLLVVSAAGEAKADLSRLEEATSRGRGGHPTAFVDLSTVEGIDVVVSWLQRELGLDPWGARRG
jgi:hypothetical protein